MHFSESFFVPFSAMDSSFDTVPAILPDLSYPTIRSVPFLVSKSWFTTETSIFPVFLFIVRDVMSKPLFCALYTLRAFFNVYTLLFPALSTAMIETLYFPLSLKSDKPILKSPSSNSVISS